MALKKNCDILSSGALFCCESFEISREFSINDCKWLLLFVYALHKVLYSKKYNFHSKNVSNRIFISGGGQSWSEISQEGFQSGDRLSEPGERNFALILQSAAHIYYKVFC